MLFVHDEFEPGRVNVLCCILGSGGLNINMSKISILDPSWTCFNSASIKKSHNYSQ